MIPTPNMIPRFRGRSWFGLRPATGGFRPDLDRGLDGSLGAPESASNVVPIAARV
jgi:hypothetical protein